MTDTASMPDANTAPIAEIMAARSSGAINSLVWGDNYAKVVENRLLKDSGMPANAAPERINMQSIPTAADDARPDAISAAAGQADPYAPAKGPGEYQVPISHDPSAEERTADITVRQALHAADLPPVTANTVAYAIDHTARQLEHADPAQLESFGSREGQALKDLWGPQFMDRVKVVDAYLDQMADKIPAVAGLLADPRARYFLADRRVVNALSQMIESRDQKLNIG